MDENINLMINFPKKAIRTLAFPLILNNLLLLLNTIVDGIWIAGLNVDSLIAIGFVTPITIIIIGIGNGLASGANSLIGRCIGVENYENASNAALHSIMLSLIASVVIPAFLLIFLRQILLSLGAASVIDLSMEYGMIYVAGSFSIFVPFMLSAVFKAEGDIKKATYPLMASTAINMIVDPVFIYAFEWGIKGAAFATVLAGTFSLLPFIYWLFIKRSSYLEVRLSDYKTNFKVYKDILTVGLPASFEQLAIATSTIIINSWMLILSSNLDVATYNVVWRVMAIGTTPVTCIAIAVSTVVAVAFGGKNYENLRTSLVYGIKLSTIIAVVIGVIFVIFAYQFAYIFSYTESTQVLIESLVFAIRILTIYVIAFPAGAVATMVFQGMGKGTYSLLLTISRTLIFELIFIYLFAFLFDYGTLGVYFGLDVGMTIGSLVSLACIILYLRRHKDYFNEKTDNLDVE